MTSVLKPFVPLFGVVAADKSGAIAQAAQWLAENRHVFEALSYIVAIVMSIAVGLYQIYRKKKK